MSKFDGTLPAEPEEPHADLVARLTRVRMEAEGIRRGGETMNDEPDIIINRRRLTSAQVMTMRVALESFAASLDEGLGDDEYGKRMTAAFLERIYEIRKMMRVGA